ncbi:hypothetical protein JCM9279_007691 [Rhodotorula babjevae]
MDPSTTDVPTFSAPQSTASILMGPTTAGYGVQMLLFGAVVSLYLQAWRTGEFRAQSRPARSAMWISLFLNCVYTGVVFYENYDASVSQDRTYNYLSNGNATWNSLSMLNGVIAGLTEAFLAVKAGSFIPSRKLRWTFWVWMTCVICLVLAGSAMATADGYLYYFAGADGDEPALVLTYNSSLAIFLYASAFADLSISATIAWALHSRIAGFNETTDSLLWRLIWLSIRSASYTTVVSIAAAVTMSVWGEDNLLSFITIALWMPMPALYGLSLFSFSFGARRAIDSRIGAPTEATPPQGGGIYVRRSVHAFDSKGVSVPRGGLSDEHEVSRPRRAPPPMRIQAMATLIMGPTSCGYNVQMLLYGAFVCAFFEGWRSGALHAQSRPARLLLWASLGLNTVYVGICVYESFDAAGERSVPRSGPFLEDSSSLAHGPPLPPVSQDRSTFYLSSGDIAWNALSALNGLIAALSEGFLAVKAGSLIASRPWRLLFWGWQTCVILLVLAASGIVTADGCLYNLAGPNDVVSLALEYNTAAALWLWSSAVADLSNSLAFARGLSSRIHGFNETTDNLLRRLILIAVRTASYTTVLSIAGAVANSVWGDDDTLGFIAIGLWLPMPALYGLSLLSFSFASRRAIDSRLGSSSKRASPPRGDGIYVKRSVHAYDSKGVSIRRTGLSSEHELSTLPARTVPSVRITVEQLRVTECDEVDLELGQQGSDVGTARGDEWRREWRGEKSWNIES